MGLESAFVSPSGDGSNPVVPRLSPPRPPARPTPPRPPSRPTPPTPPAPPSSPARAVGVVMPADRAGATVYVDDVTPTPGGHTGTLDASGQCVFTTVSARIALPQSYVRVTAAGFQRYE